jgi:hypothetical protein
LEYFQEVEDWRKLADLYVKDRKMLYIFLKHYWDKKLNGGMIYYVRSD